MELTNLLSSLVSGRGSDIHLVPGQPPVLRVDGELVRQDMPPLSDATIEQLLAPYLSDGWKSAMGQDLRHGDITIREGGRAFRCQAFLDRGRLGAAIRLVPLGPPTLEDLGLTGVLAPLLRSTRGLVLVTGHTGSGKSTTTAAIIETLNRTCKRRVLTLEDPIEYEYESKQCVVTQHAVGQDVASFEIGAQIVLRSDPDVVSIGELRTLESIWWAMTLADTGHLVFTIMHTTSVTESLRRIIDIFPDPRDSVRMLLARCLTAVVSQRLLPRSDQPGRVAANEVLIANPRIRGMIADGQTEMGMAIEAGRDQGMQTMDDSILSHYKKGTISYDTAWYSMSDRDRLGRPEAMAS